MAERLIISVAASAIVGKFLDNSCRYLMSCSMLLFVMVVSKFPYVFL